MSSSAVCRVVPHSACHEVLRPWRILGTCFFCAMLPEAPIRLEPRHLQNIYGPAEIAEKLPVRLWHDFSRALNAGTDEGSPWVLRARIRRPRGRALARRLRYWLPGGSAQIGLPATTSDRCTSNPTRRAAGREP